MSDSTFVAMTAVLMALFCCIEGKMTVLYHGSYPDPGPNQIGRWVTSRIEQKNDRCPGKALQHDMGYPVIELDGARWRLFWWYQANTTWPASVTDVLQDNYGDCDVDSPYCFSRLPEALQEDGAEILAEDSAGTVYRWAFDSSNNVAHATWRAFHDGIESSLKNQNAWNPVVLQGKAPQTQQDSFQYKMEFGVKSVMLDDDSCDCYSTLSMGHGICFLAGARFNEYVFGVDLLYHENDCGPVASTVPVPTNGLSIFFKDADDCINADCQNGCLDGVDSFTCLGN
ncbi:uncharacterized protein [Asterias amurensis]|uniref:uncharacterized protein n=1 Tax=Asterias amurensis TaxID=7602 RepID=UPI003AB66620